MKKVNYHTHTKRCGHAQGNEEDMVQAAIAIGIEDLGLCCHVPLPHYRRHLLFSIPYMRSLRDIPSLVYSFVYNGPHMRMPYSTMEDHFQTIEKCQQKYSQIHIYKGFEAEGLPQYFDYYQSLLQEGKVDYLILGHHFHRHCIHSDYFGKINMTKKDIYQYCNDVEKAIETNLFSYIAHPDLFLCGYHDFGIDMQTVTRRICQKAKEYNIPLEVNAGGIRKGLIHVHDDQVYPYPNKYFWKIVGEVGNDVILGFDAHDPSDFNQGMYDMMMNFAKTYHLRVVDHFEFKKGKI